MLTILLQAVDPSALDAALYVAGQIVGDIAHAANVSEGVVIVGGVALCGAAVSLIGRRLFWIGQVGCEDCRRELQRREPQVSDWADKERPQ